MFRFRLGTKSFRHGVDDRGNIHGAEIQPIGARFDAAQLLQVVHQSVQPVCLGMDPLEGFLGGGQHAVH